MCGIFALINKTNFNQNDEQLLLNEFMKIKHRGPDNTNYIINNSNIFMGFHRLSINDLSESGDQPFVSKLQCATDNLQDISSEPNNITLICNGEIYNYKELVDTYNLELKSNSDCEVILHLYLKLGFIETIKLLDGVFACVLHDKKNDIIYAARDPFGIRSLYIGENANGTYGFCSELKGICLLLNNIKQFNSGCTWNSHDRQFKSYKYILKNPVYDHSEIRTLQHNIRTKLTNSIRKRLLADRPIGCLLSGGFDSSIVSALLAQELNKSGKILKTFSVGLADSTDLKYAKLVAAFINSDHHELILSESDMLAGIDETIHQFETWDVTTIRAGVPMFLLAKYIKANFDTTIIMSGEAADESSGSYLYFKNAPDDKSFQEESERLMNDLSYYDALRVDKSISGAGLECRIPFIDRDFLDFYMNIDPKFKNHNYKNIEKYLLRSSFEFEKLLPNDVLWRRKEAFSDGVSSTERSWYTIIQEYANNKYTDVEFETFKKNNNCKNTPYSKESLLFRDIFTKYYPKNINTIPYYWVPKFMGDIMEPSARVLKF